VTREHQSEKEKANLPAARGRSRSRRRAPDGSARPYVHLQRQVGNRALQRLLAQRAGSGPTELDDDTADQIERVRGGGHPLDTRAQEEMGAALGQDFSGVNIHTTPEANELNHQLGARAFTTGQDIFFREGAYQPQSSSGRELLAHELTHVIQQASSAATSSGPMTVNVPGDTFEQEADTVARAVASGTTHLQREEDTQIAQIQELEEQALQMQEISEEDEELLQ
jgi:hypothetical protein